MTGAQGGGRRALATSFPFFSMEDEMLQKVKKFFSQERETAGELPAAVEWSKQCALTPDIWKLEQFMFQLIFVPDDMMIGQKNHSLIREASYSERPQHPSCFTLKKFTFWKKDLGGESFPIAMEEDYTPTGYLRVKPIPSRIKGELYAIRSTQFIKLDMHRQNGVQFRRIKTDITLPYRHVLHSRANPIPNISEDFIRTEKAWMYVGVPEYWDDMIGDMFLVRELNHFEFDMPRRWIDRYYKFE